MSGPSPLDPVTDWEAVRTLPEGAALADAYLTLRQEFQSLMVMAQGAARAHGSVTPEALLAHIDKVYPLLKEPYGRAWTDGYYQMSHAHDRAAKTLCDGLRALAGEKV